MKIVPAFGGFRQKNDGNRGNFFTIRGCRFCIENPSAPLSAKRICVKIFL